VAKQPKLTAPNIVRTRRAYFDCRFGQLHVRTAFPTTGGFDEMHPEWSPDGILYFVSDRSGWWNLCRYDGGTTQALLDYQAEFGMPQWVFRMSTYGFASADDRLS
jgi:Tol biopolymer transport system component